MARNGNGNGGSAPRRSGARAGSFGTGSLGSPWSRETYGDTGVNPGDADYQSGPRISSGVLGRRVKMDVSQSDRGGNFSRGGSDGTD